MPDDLIHHILALVRKSKAVKYGARPDLVADLHKLILLACRYLIIYPHREASHATLAGLGKVGLPP